MKEAERADSAWTARPSQDPGSAELPQGARGVWNLDVAVGTKSHSPARLSLLPLSSMLVRRSLPVLGRLLTFAVAGIAALGVVDCSKFVARNGTLDGSLSRTPYSAPGRVRATLDEVLSGANGTYI